MYRIGSDTLENVVIYVLFNEASAATSSSALHLLFSPRPPSHTCHIHICTTSYIQASHLPPIAFEVYDRIPRQIRRTEAYGTQLKEPPAWMKFPRFTLAPDEPPKLNLTLNWPLRSYDLLNKWRLVHGAYTYDNKVGVLVAFVIDSEGENYEVKTWKLDEGQGLRKVLEWLWTFFEGFAEMSALEWRLAVCRLGVISREEVNGEIFPICFAEWRLNSH
jgi:hypothetical protein